MHYLIIDFRFGSKLLAAPLPRIPPACGGRYVVARPRLGFGAPRLTPRRLRQPCWRRRRRHRHRRSLLHAPAWCVRLEVLPPASALSPARSALLAVLFSLRSLSITHLYVAFTVVHHDVCHDDVHVQLYAYALKPSHKTKCVSVTVDKLS